MSPWVFADSLLTDGGNTLWVRRLSNLPPAVSGVITIPDGTSLHILGHIDLEGARLSFAGVADLIGTSSETASLTSTGLDSGTALLTTSSALRAQNIAIKDVGTAIAISGDSATALDWNAFNFVNVPTIGTIDGYGNLIVSDSAYLNSKGLTITGDGGTVGFTDSLFTGDGDAGAIITIDADATISRRFRMTLCSMVVTGSTEGIDADAGATIPDESFILNTVNFSGGGTYLGGLDYTSNTSLIEKCVGVVNTAAAASMYVQNNATATTIGATSTPVKVAGTTTAGTENQRFSHTSNRLTYTGAFSDVFKVTAVASFTSNNNNQIGFYLAVNGTADSTTGMYATANASGRFESLTIQGNLLLDPGDYVEVFVENNTATNNVTVTFLNVNIGRTAP